MRYVLEKVVKHNDNKKLQILVWQQFYYLLQYLLREIWLCKSTKIFKESSSKKFSKEIGKTRYFIISEVLPRSWYPNTLNRYFSISQNDLRASVLTDLIIWFKVIRHNVTISVTGVETSPFILSYADFRLFFLVPFSQDTTSVDQVWSCSVCQ